jgi:hypothetical protein
LTFTGPAAAPRNACPTGQRRLDLDGLLILPVGKSRAAGPFPLITAVHRGPYDRYADQFHGGLYPRAQWLATAGYAVFLPNPRALTRSWASGGVPQAMLRAEPLHFDQLDVGVFGPVDGSAGYPPIGTGQACGQVGTSSGFISLLRSTTLGNDFAVGRLPQRDRPRLSGQHHGVIPAPHHHIGAARHLGDSYQVTGRDPLRPGPRELRCVPDGYKLTFGQDLADILFDPQHYAAAKSRGGERVRG